MRCTVHGVQSRKDLIDELTKSEDGRETLRHCYRGNHFRGVLWSVVERQAEDEEPYRFIRCDVIEYSGDEWWYRPMCESDGPTYYSCPLGYLDLVPETDKGFSREWREKVKAYHQQRKQRNGKAQSRVG